MQFNYPLGGHDLFLLVSFYGFLSAALKEHPKYTAIAVSGRSKHQVVMMLL